MFPMHDSFLVHSPQLCPACQANLQSWTPGDVTQGRKTVRKGGKKNKKKLIIGLDRWREEGVEGEGGENMVGAFAWPGLRSRNLLISAILRS